MDSENKIIINDTTDAVVNNGDSKSDCEESDCATSQSLVDINGDLKLDSDAAKAIEINGDSESDSSSSKALELDGDSESDTDATQGLNNTNRISNSDSASSKAIEVNEDDSGTDSDVTEAINNNNTNGDSESDSDATQALEIGENLVKDSDATQTLNNGETESSPRSSSSSSSEDCFQLGITKEEAMDRPEKDPPSAPEPEQQPPPRVTFQIAGAPPPPPPPAAGYRIPSYVFARTKSTAPAEWSTASNESLFSIHMGNTSFSRDQLFLQGKSGELGAPSNPFLDITKPSHTDNFAGDFRAEAEAKAAETLREVIRELSADDTPVSPKEPSAISRHHGESTKSFAFPVLGSDGDKSVSVKVGAVPAEQQKQQEGTVKATPVDSPKANQMVPQNRLFSIPCFSCCRPSCF